MPKSQREISRLLASHGLSAFEIRHAIDSSDARYGDECVVRLENGRQIRSPSYPSECDYVRVAVEPIDGEIYEIAYWTAEEWARNPQEVMGAIIGAAHSRKRESKPPIVTPEIVLAECLDLFREILHSGTDDTTADLIENQCARIRAATEKQISKDLFVIYDGDLGGGFTLYGPFGSDEEASNIADSMNLPSGNVLQVNQPPKRG